MCVCVCLPGQQLCVRMAPLHPVWILLGFAPLSTFCLPPIWTQPEQVHLSYPGEQFQLFSSAVNIFHFFDFGLFGAGQQGPSRVIQVKNDSFEIRCIAKRRVQFYFRFSGTQMAGLQRPQLLLKTPENSLNISLHHKHRYSVVFSIYSW